MKRRDFIKATALSAIVPSLYLQSCGRDSSIPVIATDPRDDGFAEYMRGFEGNEYLKGIRYFFSSESEIIDKRVTENI